MAILVVSGGWLGYQKKKQIDAVKKWDAVVLKAVEGNGIPDYKNLVLAIILTESKGSQTDVMQSSESKDGSISSIKSSKESIDYGVSFLAKAITKAENQNCDVWTAVQAYNFGLAYIDYVAENGGKNTTKLAEKYSKKYLAPTLGNTTQKKYRYLHLPAILYNGGYLYKNGGNFFYADIVKINEFYLSLF